MSKEYLGEMVKVKMDRPMGSKHPKHGFVYPVNYGYIPNTVSGDGEELDAYVLGVFEPLETFEGKVIAVIHRTSDNDDKLVVVPANKTYTDEQIRALTEFQEQWFESEIWRQNLQRKIFQEKFRILKKRKQLSSRFLLVEMRGATRAKSCQWQVFSQSREQLLLRSGSDRSEPPTPTLGRNTFGNFQCRVPP